MQGHSREDRIVNRGTGKVTRVQVSLEAMLRRLFTAMSLPSETAPHDKDNPHLGIG
jgi:hypothetical protein